MRKIYDFTRKWAFRKGECKIPDRLPNTWDFVNLPHTWNAIDGQDGGNDYYRGTCLYAKELSRRELPKAQRYYLEIQGANSSADVYLNGKHLSHHDGGYSRFRVDITDTLAEENLFVIAAILIAGIGGLKIQITDSIQITTIATALILGIVTNAVLGCIEKRHNDTEKETE